MTAVPLLRPEFGIAALAGKTVRQRMKALTAFAHPQFREELERKAFEIYNVRL
jgi:acyl-CoA hydrolase